MRVWTSTGAKLDAWLCHFLPMVSQASSLTTWNFIYPICDEHWYFTALCRQLNEIMVMNCLAYIVACECSEHGKIFYYFIITKVAKLIVLSKPAPCRKGALLSKRQEIRERERPGSRSQFS